MNCEFPASIDEDTSSINPNSKDIHLSVNDSMLRYSMFKLFKEFKKNNSSIFREKVALTYTKEQWSSFVENLIPNFTVLYAEVERGLVIHGESNYFIEFSFDYTGNLDIIITGSKGFIFEIIEMVSKNIRDQSLVQWYYDSKMNYVDISVDLSKQPVQEMYPFLKEPLSDYYDRYLKSSASILFLVGPPGTGKTSLIKGLLSHSGGDAVVSYNMSLLSDDSLFANFIGGDKQFMILEDSDTYIQPRTEGNSMIHRFLNVADGLISVKNKKLIFSTNLESITDIDPALIRKGRCFDILKFDYLNYDQAKKLGDRFGIDISKKEEYTVADVFNQEDNHSDQQRKIGFI